VATNLGYPDAGQFKSTYYYPCLSVCPFVPPTSLPACIKDMFISKSVYQYVSLSF
jgi:hypothetical protein